MVLNCGETWLYMPKRLDGYGLFGMDRFVERIKMEW